MKSLFKNNIIKGTLILTIASILARIIGFYNRIFLCNLFGEREMGIFQMILPIYMVVFSFCCQGIQTGLTRQIARIDENDILSKRCLLRYAILISLIASILCSLIIHYSADYISVHILHATECIRCLKLLIYAFPFVTIKGCFIGYFIGIQKSGVSAFSQLIEQTAKILSVFLIASYITSNPPKAYFALYGVICGEFFSCMFMIICYIIHIRKQLNLHPQTNNIKKTRLIRPLVSDAVPLTANRLSITFLQSFESILIPNMLCMYLDNGNASLILYGTLTGLVLPCIMFPTTLTSALSTMLLPAISSEHASESNEKLKMMIKKSIYFCSGIGIASTTFLLLFGKWAGKVILSSETAGELLFQFAFLCPFIYLSACLASIMNGLGKAGMNLIFSIICSGIRIAFILILVPLVGLKGYMWGLMSSYLLQTFLLLSVIYKSTRSKKLS